MLYAHVVLLKMHISVHAGLCKMYVHACISSDVHRLNL